MAPAGTEGSSSTGSALVVPAERAGSGGLDLVLGALWSATDSPGLSAAEVGERIGSSWVTARRYLEHLADAGRVVRHPRYGSPGRPEVEYRPS